MASISPSPSGDALHTSNITSLTLVRRGKVRDVYQIDADHWLLVATDRVSAFDVTLPDVIPGKGKLLTTLALFWFDRVQPIIGNHLTSVPLEEVLSDPGERAQAIGRSMVVRRLDALPVEAVVRGHLAGSGWKDYVREGRVCGIELPAGLQQAERLPTPLFTPSTKAATGAHDEPITFGEVERLVGHSLAAEIRQASLAIYRFAAARAEARGLILADTKFEFGTDAEGKLVLMDEVLTPDSSRFWEAATWRLGTSPPSYDKQYVRDWLETLDWGKTPPGPAVPPDIVEGTLRRYAEAVRRLTGPDGTWAGSA